MGQKTAFAPQYLVGSEFHVLAAVGRYEGCDLNPLRPLCFIFPIRRAETAAGSQAYRKFSASSGNDEKQLSHVGARSV